MALSTALYTLLHNNASIVGVMATRIYPGVAPMDTALPLIVYEIDNILPTIAIGALNDFDNIQVSVQVVGTKHSDVEIYAGYVRTALDGYTGTVDTEAISSIVYNGQEPSYDPDFIVSSAAQGIAVFIRTLNFTIIRL
jgi:hypothetical protein